MATTGSLLLEKAPETTGPYLYPKPELRRIAFPGTTEVVPSRFKMLSPYAVDWLDYPSFDYLMQVAPRDLFVDPAARDEFIGQAMKAGLNNETGVVKRLRILDYCGNVRDVLWSIRFAYQNGERLNKVQAVILKPSAPKRLLNLNLWFGLQNRIKIRRPQEDVRKLRMPCKGLGCMGQDLPRLLQSMATDIKNVRYLPSGEIEVDVTFRVFRRPKDIARMNWMLTFLGVGEVENDRR